jgi:hypothetical protein
MLLSQNYLGIAGTGGPPAPPSVPLEYVGKVQDAVNNRTSYDLGAVPCGATGANRTNIFVIWLENNDSAEFTTPTVTINGDIVVADRTVNLGIGGRFVGFYRARPSGLTCNIKINDFGVNADNNVIFVYRADALIELYDRTRYDYQNSISSTTILRRTLGVPADGFMIGMVGIAAASGTLTLTYDGSGDVTTADDTANDGVSVRGEVFSYDNDGNPDDTLVFAMTPSASARRNIAAVSYYYLASPPAQSVRLFTPLGFYGPGTGRTIKTRIPASWLLATIPPDANRWVFRFTSALTNAATSNQMDSCYIGHAAASGDAYDADSLSALSFGGGASLLISSATAAGLESDVKSFVWDGVSDLILSCYINTTTPIIPSGTLSGAASFHRSGDFASTANAASFVEQNTNILSMIECVRAWHED